MEEGSSKIVVSKPSVKTSPRRQEEFATINDLPLEVLRHIVEAVHAIDEAVAEEELEIDDEEFEKTSRLWPPTYIENLSSVNKTFRDLCQELLWRRVDFEGNDNSALDRFVDHVLPNYGHLIKELVFPIVAPDEDDDTEDWEDFNLSDRFFFLYRILDGVPNIESLDLQLPSEGDEFIFPEEDGAEHFIAAIGRLAPTLRSFSLFDCPQLELMAKLISRLPLLEKLDIASLPMSDFDPFPDGPDPLFEALAALEHLQELVLSDCECIFDGWGRWPKFRSDLIFLSISRCQPISSENLDKFIEIQGDKLQTLVLDEALLTPLNVKDPVYKLPSLKSLHLLCLNTSLTYLERFKGSTLESLVLGKAHWGSFNLPLFIESKSLPCLKYIAVSEPHYTEDEVNRLKKVCSDLGIQWIRSDFIDDTETEEDEDEMFEDDDWISDALDDLGVDDYEEDSEGADEWTDEEILGEHET